MLILSRIFRAGAAVCVLVLGVAACSYTPPPPDLSGEAVLSASVIARASLQGELDNHHADLASPINSRNVTAMQLAWTYPTPDNLSHTPLVRDGRVYFADWGGNVYAADAITGRLIWQRHVQTPQRDWPWHGFCGTGALGGGMLFEASAEGSAVGLDASSGQVKWQVRFTDQAYAGNCGQLLYYDGLVYIPVSSVDEPMTARAARENRVFAPNFAGSIVALDAKTGNKVWERTLVRWPENGVAVSSGLALDPLSNMLFFTTGNNYTGDGSELSDSVIAAEPKTGRIMWYYQATAHDVWLPIRPLGPGYSFAAGPQLFSVTINAQPRDLVAAGQKSGVLWALDRQTGQVVWRTVVSNGGTLGGIHADAAIGADRIFVWGNDAYTRDDPRPDRHLMKVLALDSATGRPVWAIAAAQPAALGTAGFLASDVYFLGSLDGMVRAYRAVDGMKLWTSPPTGSIAAPLVASGDCLYVGTGVPKELGGGEGRTGLFVFRLGTGATAGVGDQVIGNR